MLILNAAAVREALPMTEAIDAMREAFAALHNESATIPVRTHIDANGLTLLTMPGVLTNPARVGAKIISLVPRNAARQLPVIQGVIVVFDPETGAPTCLLEGQTLTALRTGAASGLATDLLARRDARHLAMLGSGPQAETQVEAVCAVRKIEEITVWSRTTANANRFARFLQTNPEICRGASCRVSTSAIDAIAGADIICSATRATEPIVHGKYVAPGTHVNAVGSFTLQMQELDSAVLHDALVVVDDVEAALTEAGELVRAIDAGAIRRDDLVTLGALVDGHHPGRVGDEVTVFKSVGVAVQDLSAAGWTAARAHTMHIGQEVDF